MALGLSQASLVQNSLPDNGRQLGSQDQIKGVAFAPRPMVSHGLKITVIKPREGFGQSTEASEKYSQSFQPDKLCQDKTFGWSYCLEAHRLEARERHILPCPLQMWLWRTMTSPEPPIGQSQRPSRTGDKGVTFTSRQQRGKECL